jgi:hypothetical protein
MDCEERGENTIRRLGELGQLDTEETAGADR